VPEKYRSRGGPGIPILVVSAPDHPPARKSRILDCLMRNFMISKTVSTMMIRLINTFKRLISIRVKTIIPRGKPGMLPTTNLFTRGKSMSLLIFTISASEITRDKIKLICIASLGGNKSNKNGVAIIENPKPVLVCNIDANKMITINKINVLKKHSPW
jgi:hypothetical protein